MGGQAGAIRHDSYLLLAGETAITLCVPAALEDGIVL